MSKFKDLTLEDKFTFGKHKGKTVGQRIIIDPGYLLWLRTERIKESLKWPGTHFGFNEEVNLLLDEVLERCGKDETRFRKFLPRPHLQVKVMEEVLEENYSTNVVEKQTEGWGAF